MIKKIWKTGAVIGTLAPLIAFAQQLPQPPITNIGQVTTLLCNVAKWLFTFFLVIAVIFILLAAYKYLTAGGDPEKVKGANQMIIYAVVALVVAIIARGIPLVVATFVGAQGITQVC